jgi:ribosomal RNA-processing protein 12
MAEKMAKGGVIKRSLIHGAQDMEEDKEDDEDAEPVADEAEATIKEYITMVAAGLVGTSPHMISATITGLSRLLFEYHEQLPSDVLNDMVSTILVFLGSANREIVKSAIGFVKVAVVALAPVDIQPHLAELVPALFNWSHEHANHFKANIRHILERMLRKFGYAEIEAITPEKDRKLLVNIKKRQQRAKKNREQAEAEGDVASDDEKAQQPRTGRNAYEDALYGSEDDNEDSDAEEAPAPAAQQGGRKALPPQQGLRKNAIGRRKDDPQQERGGEQYINEGDEPLDLLEDNIGRVSRRDPRAEEARQAKRAEGNASRFKTDSRGKLIFNNEDGDDNAGLSDGDGDENGMDSTGAYLEAINGEDGFRRGQGGKLKFNKPTKRGRAQMEEDELVADVKDRLEGMGMIKQNVKKQKKVKENIGQEFKAKKAGGDVKKDGVNPYAYVPLGNGKKRSNLNIVGKGKRH